MFIYKRNVHRKNGTYILNRGREDHDSWHTDGRTDKNLKTNYKSNMYTTQTSYILDPNFSRLISIKYLEDLLHFKHLLWEFNHLNHFFMHAHLISEIQTLNLKKKYVIQTLKKIPFHFFFYLKERKHTSSPCKGF